MKERTSGFFWVSFTDLMTSLFFIMLVLYVLTFAKLHAQQKATQKQLDDIKKIQTAVQKLPQAYFTYQPDYKRFSLNRQVQFPKGSDDIPADYSDYLLKVGESIQGLISMLKTTYQSENIQYLIVIEGMASDDNYTRNDELSYQRALALYTFWANHHIVFDPNVCDIQIAGSGERGIGRFTGDDESKNQRFLIQIVPKIGDLEQK
jgi:outer membrane protein OmpA-like peptidoglycan-associated protein